MREQELSIMQLRLDRLERPVLAQVRSQAGPGASSALTALPTSHHTWIPAHLFRVTLLRLRTGAGVASNQLTTASCARLGVLRRGFALESAGAACAAKQVDA